MIGHGRERRGPRDEVLEAIDSLLDALGESARRNRDATRRAQTIRRVRSHGRSYTEILERSTTPSAHRLTAQTAMAPVRASERLEGAEVRALRDEGLGVDRIAVLCGLTRTEVEVVIGDGRGITAS